MSKITLAAVFLAAALSGSANAQEKTPASAYEFIRQNIGDGSWQGKYEHCYGSDNCSDEFSPVRYVMYQNATYCQLRFTMNANNSPTREIDLTKSFSIYGYYYQGERVFFNGPVRMTNGEIRREWELIAPSRDIRTRIVAAFEYLQSVCKPASAW